MSDNLARVIRPSRQEPSHTDHLGSVHPGAGHQAARRHIEIVSSRSQRRARPRIIYALSAVTGMAVIVVAQLLLSVGISQGAYELSTLQASKVELGRTAESVSENLVKVSSPQSLAANAEALGMVSNSNPVYLRLSDGAVLGVPVSASGDQGASAELVPNALLAGVPLVTQLTPKSVQGTGVLGRSHVAAAVPAKAAPVPATNGLPSPTTH